MPSLPLEARNLEAKASAQRAQYGSIKEHRCKYKNIDSKDNLCIDIDIETDIKYHINVRFRIDIDVDVDVDREVNIWLH